jgi:cytochrome c553
MVALACGAAVAAQESKAQPQYVATLVKTDCASCHGLDGSSPETIYPRLSGQQRDYLMIQLKAFRDRTRGGAAASAYMWTQTSQVSDDMIVKLAEYFSRQPPAHAQITDPSALQDGQAIFERGSPPSASPRA